MDTNALIWLDIEPGSLSKEARRLLRRAHIAVAAITWFEMALLVRGGRVHPKEPVRAWLGRIQQLVTKDQRLLDHPAGRTIAVW